LYDYNFDTQSPSAPSDAVGWHYVVQHSKSGDAKPGLLSMDPFNNQVRFDITGCRSLVEISFLRSYENFGDARAVLVADGVPGASTVLPGHWESITSQAASAELHIPVARPMRLELVIELQPPPRAHAQRTRAKILQVRCR